jgi:ActR/RegA family two-component response regulator
MQVIMLTGHASIESGVEGMKLGAFDYLVKPCDIEVLTKAINEAHAQRRKNGGA